MTVRSLPVVSINGRPHYRDDRLREYRRVDLPWVAVSFDEVGQ